LNEKEEMNYIKESGDQAKETPYSSDTHDFLRYLLSKINTHIHGCANPGCQNSCTGSQNSQWMCKKM